MLETGIASGIEGTLYVVEINTDFTEPGWNVSVMRQNASVDLFRGTDFTQVESA